jgi:hypothetical protein
MWNHGRPHGPPRPVTSIASLIYFTYSLGEYEHIANNICAVSGKTGQIYDVHLRKVSQIILARNITAGTLVGVEMRVSNLGATESTLQARKDYPPVYWIS